METAITTATETHRSSVVPARRSTAALIVAVALTLTLTAPASAALSGTYRGDTNQNRTAHVKIKRGTITQLSFAVVSRCGLGGSEGSTTDILLVKNVKVKARGRFTYTEKGDSTNGLASFTLKGRATRKRVTGSVEQFFRNGCQVFELTFVAKRR